MRGYNVQLCISWLVNISQSNNLYLDGKFELLIIIIQYFVVQVVKYLIDSSMRSIIERFFFNSKCFGKCFSLEQTIFDFFHLNMQLRERLHFLKFYLKTIWRWKTLNRNSNQHFKFFNRNKDKKIVRPSFPKMQSNN